MTDVEVEDYRTELEGIKTKVGHRDRVLCLEEGLFQGIGRVCLDDSVAG